MPAPFRSIVEPEVAAAYRAAGWWGDRTVGDFLRDHAAAQPGATAYVDADGHRLTWQQLEDASDRLAGALVEAGVTPGERCGVLLPDGPTVHAAFLACENAGVTVVGIGSRAGIAEIRHLLGRTGASTLVTLASFRDEPASARFETLRHELPALRHHVVVPRFEQDPEGEIVVDRATGVARPLGAAERATRRMGPDDLFLVNSTSGTTGLPKIVTHTQNRWWYFHQRAVANGGLSPDEVILGAVPAPFGFGIWTAHVTPIVLGATCVVPERFSADAVVELIERERVTMLCCVSTQFVLMLDSPALRHRDLSSLRVMFTGGEAVPSERALEFERRTGCTILQFYGSNETGLLSGTRLDDPTDLRLTTAGRVVDDMQVRLFDSDRRDVTATGYGQPGCRGPATSTGYLDDPAANAELLTDDGWMLMGDLCRVDERGYLTVVGRTSDIIIRGGKNISAAQVETEVVTHRSVALAAAVPMDDPVFGERVCVYVQLHGGEELTLDELCSHLLARGMGKELLPERLVVVDALPLSSGGKVAKGELRADIARRLADGE